MAIEQKTLKYNLIKNYAQFKNDLVQIVPVTPHPHSPKKINKLF